jgi:hypothetical protein
VGARLARIGAVWRWAWLPALVAFAVWHAIFDLTLRDGMNHYLIGRDAYLAGAGPEVTIRGVMEAARQRGALWGLAGAAPAFVLTAAVRALIVRRRRPGSAGAR